LLMLTRGATLGMSLSGISIQEHIILRRQERLFIVPIGSTHQLHAGWIDTWRHVHGRASEYTWYSRRRGGLSGNGYRLDHAFVTPTLLPFVRDCRYSHAEREAGLSDHSLLILEIED